MRLRTHMYVRTHEKYASCSIEVMVSQRIERGDIKSAAPVFPTLGPVT